MNKKIKEVTKDEIENLPDGLYKYKINQNLCINCNKFQIYEEREYGLCELCNKSATEIQQFIYKGLLVFKRKHEGKKFDEEFRKKLKDELISLYGRAEKKFKA